MKNKLFKTLFLIIMVFSLSICSDVRANDVLDGNAATESENNWTSTSGASNWLYINYEGIRITLVDSNGDRLANTVSADYFSSYKWNEVTKTVEIVNSQTIETGYHKNAATKGMRKEIPSEPLRYPDAISRSKFTFNTLDFYPYYSNTKDNDYPWASEVSGNYFERYFMNMDQTKLNSILSELTNNNLDKYLPKSQICGGELYFVIEPLTAIKIQEDVWRTYVGTVTELANIYQDRGAPSGLTPFFPHIAFSIYMDENKKVGGFTGFNGVKNTSISLTDVLDKKQGYALGVFKLSDLAKCSTTCWKPETTCDPIECTNTDSNNTTTCRKKTVSYKCEYDEKDNDYNSAGEKTFDINESCSLYCTETATVSYPGNIGAALSIYEPFAWPTNGGKYPLKTKGTLTCTPMMNNGEDADATCLAKLATLDKSNFKYKNSTTTAQVNYQHYQYDNSISADLVQTCEPSTFGINRDGKYEITSNCTYTLSSDKNVAISKEKADLINSAAIKYANTVNNFILITKYKGVLPQSGFSWIDDAHTFESLYDALEKITFSKNYELRIKNMPLGHNGEFTTLLNDDKHEYVCKYNITLAPSTECICPPGTVWAGTDINGKIKDTAQTCAEAKEIYCNQETITPPKHNNPACPPDSKYPERNCTDYINNGGTEAECIANWCNDTCTTNCDYVCPKKSDYPGMDISACVSGQLGAGKKLAQAQSYCIEKNCYRGANIIYRTISLENPFPSKDADAKVNQTGLTKGMFNTIIKGRYPGTNWNSVTLVRNKILNNRGYSGSEIYEKAKPLYVIELDPTAIKKIREYNKRQEDVGGYADFTLKCTDGAYCISSFIRSGITTADGTNMLTGGTCASASNKKTFTNCYTYK